jgi:radical SAM PhpK family P-methyltransferase
MADCLIVGFYEGDFPRHEERVRGMGREAGAYKDLALSFVRYEGRPLRALDVINRFRQNEHLHNADFIWPVILVLGTSLHRRGHSFDYINLPHLEQGAFRDKLAAPDLKAVALTSTLYTEPQPLKELVAFVRAKRPGIPIIIGGPYVAGQAKVLEREALEEQLSYIGADVYVISAEGERALGEAIDALKSNAPMDGIDNLAFRRNERLIFTRCSTESNSLAENMVDYGLVPREAFGQFVTTRTAKSCPFSCAFCGFPERAGDYTYLSVTNVQKELNAIAAIGGVTTLTIIDDTFNVPKKRFKDILRMMIRERYGFRWNSFFRCDHADEETVDLMAEAGCEGVILGVESGSDEILRLMNKTARRAHYLKFIPRLEAAGIDCYASLIVGFPGETEATVQESIELIEIAGPSYFRAQLWYCDPITPIYRQRLMHGLRGDGFNWSHRTMDVTEACDHIDRMFFSVENSIWQPQAGFEFWSTFYLQRRGMKREQVRAFIRSFNAAVKDKLLRPRGGMAELSIARAHDFARLSDFNVGDLGRLEAPPLSGAAYVAAERYWRDALRDLAADERAGLGPRDMPSYGIAAVGEATIGLDALAAVLVLINAALQGRWRTVLLSQDGEELELLPLYIKAVPTMRFREMVTHITRSREESRRHRPFSMPILQRETRRSHLGIRPTAALVDDEAAWRATLAEYPALTDNIRVILDRGRDNVVRLRTRLGSAVTAQLVQLTRSMLYDVDARQLNELISDISVASREPAFNFE